MRSNTSTRIIDQNLQEASAASQHVDDVTGTQKAQQALQRYFNNIEANRKAIILMVQNITSAQQEVEDAQATLKQKEAEYIKAMIAVQAAESNLAKAMSGCQAGEREAFIPSQEDTFFDNLATLETIYEFPQELPVENEVAPSELRRDGVSVSVRNEDTIVDTSSTETESGPDGFSNIINGDYSAANYNKGIETDSGKEEHGLNARKRKASLEISPLSPTQNQESPMLASSHKKPRLQANKKSELRKRLYEELSETLHSGSVATQDQLEAMTKKFVELLSLRKESGNKDEGNPVLKLWQFKFLSQSFCGEPVKARDGGGMQISDEVLLNNFYAVVKIHLYAGIEKKMWENNSRLHTLIKGLPIKDKEKLLEIVLGDLSQRANSKFPADFLKVLNDVSLAETVYKTLLYASPRISNNSAKKGVSAHQLKLRCLGKFIHENGGVVPLFASPVPSAPNTAAMFTPNGNPANGTPPNGNPANRNPANRNPSQENLKTLLEEWKRKSIRGVGFRY